MLAHSFKRLFSVLTALAIVNVFVPMAFGESPLGKGAKVGFVQDAEGVSVKLDDRQLTRYVFSSGNKPILFPVVGPGGQELTRGYPMREAAKGEKADHVHHRSFWLTHGDVNGVDYWSEPMSRRGHKDPNHRDGVGKIVHKKVVSMTPGKIGTLVTRSDWIDDKGKPILSELKTLRFRDATGSHGAYLIDCESVLTAIDDAVFGDTKEGSFGIRVAGTMKVDSKLGGRVLSNRGKKDKDAWGKTAEWVDYTGPLATDTNAPVGGIAIMNHPKSFGFPCRWHVRTYGLFAANPFGVHHFVGGDKTPGVPLKQGESMTLRYQVVLHQGLDEEALGAIWNEYAK